MKSDIKLTDQQEKILENILYKNKEKINKIFSIVLVIFITLLIFLLLFGNNISNYYGANWCRNIIIASLILTLVVSISMYFLNIKANLKSIILNITLIFQSGVFYFIYPSTITLFVLPILLSIMYFDKHIVVCNSIAVSVVFITSLILNIWLDKTSSAFRDLHVFEVIYMFESVKDTCIYVFLPRMLVIISSTIIGLFAAINGKKIFVEQAISSNEISVLTNTISTASEIQKNALPHNAFLSKNNEIEIYSIIKSAKETAGDFYDYFYLDDNNLVFLVADVSDKGLPAAMFMMEAKNTIKLCVQNFKDLGLALSKANEILKTDSNDMFTTLWIGSINIYTGKVNYINAGHVYPFVKHANKEITEITNEPNLFIGMFDSIKYDVCSFTLQRDETLVLYTDGATDAINSSNESFGKENFINSINGDSANQICDNLYNAIEKHIGNENQFDDITIMAIKRLNSISKNSEELTLELTEDSISKVINNINKYIQQVSTEKARKDLDIIIDEICVNICDYSNATMYKVNYEKNGDSLIIKFIDDGIEFNPLLEEYDINNPLSIGGKGIHLVKNLADEIDYKREDNKNILTVIKNLTKDYE